MLRALGIILSNWVVYEQQLSFSAQSDWLECDFRASNRFSGRQHGIEMTLEVHECLGDLIAIAQDCDGVFNRFVFKLEQLRQDLTVQDFHARFDVA